MWSSRTTYELGVHHAVSCPTASVSFILPLSPLLLLFIFLYSPPPDHMSSTCAIRGEGVPGGVCDEAFRVQKTRGLRVADASVFPGVLAAHTQAAVSGMVMVWKKKRIN